MAHRREVLVNGMPAPRPIEEVPFWLSRGHEIYDPYDRCQLLNVSNNGALNLIRARTTTPYQTRNPNDREVRVADALAKGYLARIACARARDMQMRADRARGYAEAAVADYNVAVQDVYENFPAVSAAQGQHSGGLGAIPAQLVPAPNSQVINNGSIVLC